MGLYSMVTIAMFLYYKIFMCHVLVMSTFTGGWRAMCDYMIRLHISCCLCHTHLGIELSKATACPPLTCDPKTPEQFTTTLAQPEVKVYYFHRSIGRDLDSNFTQQKHTYN